MSKSSSISSPSHYDSHGDYQADDASGKFPHSKSMSLYKEQDSLPHLPVNSIADTIQRLKPSCLALVPSTDQKKERENFLKACESFPEEAKALQRLLEERAQTEDNWLQSWWNRVGYLRVRDPSPINVNYMMNFPQTRKSQQRQRQRQQQRQRSNKSFRTFDNNPLGRGAKLLHSTFAFSELVRSGNLPQGRFGKKQTPLCSSMYKYMFYSCRIPQKEQDLYRVYHCGYYPNDVVPKHAVVSARGHYFSVPLTDPTDGRQYSIREIEVALHECVDQASSLVDDAFTSGADAVRNLGLLTTANRDEWAVNRTFLVENVGGMKDALRQLESGLVLLCLDLDGDVDAKSDSTKNPAKFFPDSLSQNSRSYIMGTQGRWYDKSIQFIMTPSANLGLNGEHSMMDGMPMVGLHDFVLQQEQSGTDEQEPFKVSPPTVTPIFASKAILDGLGKTDRETIHAIKEKAASDFDRTRHSLDLEVQSFRGYGADWIKKHGKCSPDAYVQMAIQLAMGKLSTAGGSSNETVYVPRATYESTQVRPFKYGRTETTRSVSAQSVEWVKAMLNSSRNNTKGDDDGSEVLKTLFYKATDAHVDYIRNASKGLGVDRHLFGLQMIQAEQQERHGETNQVALFQDPLFVRSKQWLVSTSTIPANPGFGPVVIPEGVGIAYDLKPDHVYFTCTSYKGLVPALSHYIEESLLEMRELMMSTNIQGQSKL